MKLPLTCPGVRPRAGLPLLSAISELGALCCIWATLLVGTELFSVSCQTGPCSWLQFETVGWCRWAKFGALADGVLCGPVSTPCLTATAPAASHSTNSPAPPWQPPSPIQPRTSDHNLCTHVISSLGHSTIQTQIMWSRVAVQTSRVNRSSG